MTPTVGFLGFGEAGSAIATGLRNGGITDIIAYDIATAERPLIGERAAAAGVTLVDSPAALAAGADVVFSAVVCAEAENAARSIAEYLTDRHWYLDINSVAPGVKASVAGDLAAVNFVDVAVMSNVSSNLAKLPLLLAGERAAEMPELLAPVQLNTEVVSPTVGDAARIKMFRSLIVKGLEALALEAMMACYSTGVHDQVLATLEGTFGKYTFPELIHHLIERHAVHGRRRAAELEEVAVSLREAGVEPYMAEAGHQRMTWDVERGLQERFQGGEDPHWLDVLASLEELRRAEQPETQ